MTGGYGKQESDHMSKDFTFHPGMGKGSYEGKVSKGSPKDLRGFIFH